MAKILIEIKGGIIQATYSDDPNLQIAIIDYDVREAGDEDDDNPFRGVSKPDQVVKNIYKRFEEDEPEILNN